MTLLILGVFVWIAGHSFKRWAPGARSALDGAVGTGPAKGVMALVHVTAVVLMVIGYRAAEVEPVYTPVPGIGHLTVALMFVALFLTGAARGSGTARSWFRHPLLLGAVVWAFAHLLVNGDLASLILFGSLGLWAAGEIVLLNRVLEPWERPQRGTLKGDIIGGVISLVLLAVIAGIHIWLGHNPFLGTFG